MKRFLSILLAAALFFTLAVPAFADMEDALTEITSRVVEILGVADDYTDFSGSHSDGPQPSWYLSWSKDGEDLSVTCTDDGTVTELDRWKYEDAYDRFYGYDAAFPAVSEAAAKRQAEAWLARLMGENERARIDSTAASLTADGIYRFSGCILKNGLESPVTFSMRIGAEGMTGYSRSDSYRGYVGSVPEARTGVGKADAAPLLKSSVEFELYYVSDGDTAYLRYIPVGAYTVVDALTGEAVDMEALYDSFGSRFYGTEAPMAEASVAAADNGLGRGLTEVELSAIENYADALSAEALDAILRKSSALGLLDFEQTRCTYTMDGDGNITASVRYTCEMTPNNLFGFSEEDYWEELRWGGTPTAVKYFTMDAKAGALIAVNTYYDLWRRDDALPAEQSMAEAFLAEFAPDMFAESGLCTLGGYNVTGDSFTFARMHDGYFYPENYMTVTLNTATNTVDSYYCNWDEDVIFAASEGIISEASALDAYTDALTVTLGYVAWPEAIDYDDPVLYAYADWGYSYVESLRLGYYYSDIDEAAGVDALTGEPILQAADGGYRYDDLDDTAEKAYIEALAAAGVGFEGESFQPAKALTMRDAVILLLSSAGYDPNAWDDETLKNEAVYQGFISASDWNAERAVTKAEFITMLLSASRYGYAAALEGIGFEAVALALGMIDGAMPAGACTRADAAALLYRFMKR